MKRPIILISLVMLCSTVSLLEAITSGRRKCRKKRYSSFSPLQKKKTAIPRKSQKKNLDPLDSFISSYERSNKSNFFLKPQKEPVTCYKSERNERREMMPSHERYGISRYIKSYKEPEKCRIKEDLKYNDWMAHLKNKPMKRGPLEDWIHSYEDLPDDDDDEFEDDEMEDNGCLYDSEIAEWQRKIADFD